MEASDDWFRVSAMAGRGRCHQGNGAEHREPRGCACYVASVVSDSAALWLLCPWDSPGKNTGVGCHALLQGIFPTQGLNLRRLLHLLP